MEIDMEILTISNEFNYKSHLEIDIDNDPADGCNTFITTTKLEQDPVLPCFIKYENR